MYIGKINPAGMPETISVLEITTPCTNPDHPVHTQSIIGNAAEIATVASMFGLNPEDVTFSPGGGMTWSYPDGRFAAISKATYAYEFIEGVAGSLPPDSMFEFPEDFDPDAFLKDFDL